MSGGTARRSCWRWGSAIVLLTLAMSRPASGQLLSWGVAAFSRGRVRCWYGVYADQGVRGGYWIRIWGNPSGTSGVMNIGFNEDTPPWRQFSYVQYATGGRHFTLRGGADQLQFWREICWGQMIINLSSANPPGGMPIVNAACWGYVRATYVPTGFGRYRQYVSGWTDVSFTPMGANGPALIAWLNQRGGGGRRPPQPNPGLTNVRVNRSPVILRIWDHGSQDGDIVDIYVDGRRFQRLTLTKRGATFSLPLVNGNHTLDVRALNEGSSTPNTASVSITGVVQGRASQQWKLKTGQTARMWIVVQVP